LKILDILTVFCIGAGAAIMFLSVLKTSKLRRMMASGVNTIRWNWLARMMVVFFVGYLAAIFLIILGYQEPLILIVGLVFLLGSVFVYLVVYSAKSDIQKINDSNEQLTAKNVELRKSNRELDQFAYRTSHDLRAPISSLKGLVQVAEFATSPEEVKQCHDMMKDRLKNLDELIQDILDLSKNSRTELHYAPVKIGNILNQLIESHRDARSQAIQIILEGNPDLIVNTDPTRFKMIVGNLISNALHYAEPSRSDSFVKVSFADERQVLTVSVKDNGVGIDPSYQQKIFEMFFRLSQNSVGSGLGLYIVKETVDKMKGTIQLISKIGEGSEFIVKLPHPSHLEMKRGA
jgi:signal transduction histidine kinase